MVGVPFSTGIIAVFRVLNSCTSNCDSCIDFGMVPGELFRHCPCFGLSLIDER